LAFCFSACCDECFCFFFALFEGFVSAYGGSNKLYLECAHPSLGPAVSLIPSAVSFPTFSLLFFRCCGSGSYGVLPMQTKPGGGGGVQKTPLLVLGGQAVHVQRGRFGEALRHRDERAIFFLRQGQIGVQGKFL
jgi:hypothetical protein